MDMYQIGRNVRKFREAVGESRAELAKYLNYQENTLCKYEIGERPFPGSRIDDICIHYNITADQLISGVVPDLSTMKMEHSKIMNLYPFLFPMALPDFQVENQYFLDSYIWENEFLSMVRNNNYDMYPDFCLDWDSVVKCRNNYNLAMGDRKLEAYAKMNYVSFMALCAMLADVIKHGEKASVIRFKDNFEIVPGDNTRAFPKVFGLSAEDFYMRLHQERVMTDVQGLITYLRTNKKLRPMAEYYDVLLYLCNYVLNGKSRQENAMIFDEALWKLTQSGNKYAKLLTMLLERL